MLFSELSKEDICILLNNDDYKLFVLVCNELLRDKEAYKLLNIWSLINEKDETKIKEQTERTIKNNNTASTCNPFSCELEMLAYYIYKCTGHTNYRSFLETLTEEEQEAVYKCGVDVLLMKYESGKKRY